MTTSRGIVLGLPIGVFAIAAAVGALLLAEAGAYGFHRDELYFVLAGRHPDWGYVDQPPLTPLLSAAAAGLLGLSPTAIRVVPALVGAAVVLLVADTARRLGGTRRSQLLAALVVAISGWLGAGHLDETTTYDVFFWTLVLWLLVPVLDGVPRGTRAWSWIAIGLVVGIALQNKTLAAALPLTVFGGLLLARRWDVLRSPWPWVAAIVAALIWAPNVVWQVAHGFTQLQMAGHIASEQGGLEGRVKAILELTALAGLLLFPVAIAGIAWLLRSPDSRSWRALGIAALLQLALMLLVGGKSYYSAGYLPFAIAAGSIPLSGWLDRGRRGLRRATFAILASVSGLLSLVILLPVVPVAALHATPIPGIYGETVGEVGWPQLAAQVGSVADRLPPADRANAVIMTGSYGQYSALTLLGAGLPPVFSGHNSTADWGRPPDGAGPVILVGFEPASVAAEFIGCRVAATVDNGLELETEEQGSQIWVCAAPMRPWSDSWPALRHIS